jgi:hypothetical protein
MFCAELFSFQMTAPFSKWIIHTFRLCSQNALQGVNCQDWTLFPVPLWRHPSYGKVSSPRNPKHPRILTETPEWLRRLTKDCRTWPSRMFLVIGIPCPARCMLQLSKIISRERNDRKKEIRVISMDHLNMVTTPHKYNCSLIICVNNAC